MSDNIRYINTLLLFLLYRLCFFFFNDTATTEIYTLSLHDALPIFCRRETAIVTRLEDDTLIECVADLAFNDAEDRKSTRLNSSHGYISYAVLCLKKKKKTKPDHIAAHADTPAHRC